MRILFNILKEIAGKLELATEELKAQDKDGKEIVLLLIKHGPHGVLAFQKKGFTELAYIMDLPPEDSKRLAELPPEAQQELLAIMKREMMEGRSGFEMAFDETKMPPQLRRISIVQRVIIEDRRPETVQRVADGIQELVVVGSRCNAVLGQVFQNIRTTGETTAKTYHPGMYA